MQCYPIADSHVDYLSNVRKNLVTLDSDIQSQINISKASIKQGNAKLIVFAAFVDAKNENNPAVACLEMVDIFHKMQKIWGMADKTATVLSIEGGDVLCGSISALNCFSKLGVRSLTLTWNYENELGTPAFINADSGLKPFGIECVKKMNELKMAVDVSHLNVAGFKDAVQCSALPIMASHSNVRAICSNPRNLYDWQIAALIETVGYIGLSVCSRFLRENKNEKELYSSLDDFVKHVKYILAMGGENTVGIGSDFDGTESWISELNGAQDYQLIPRALEKEGIPRNVIEKICFTNFYNFIKRFI